MRLPVRLLVPILATATACAGARQSADPVSEPAPTEAPAPTPAPEPEPTASPATIPSSAGEIRVLPVAHATFQLAVTGGPTVWVDPVAQDGSVAALEALGKGDVVLVTDIHGDHMDPAGITAVRSEQATVIAPNAVAEALGDQAGPVTRLGNGETTEAAGITVTAVPMYNVVRGPAEGQVFHEKGRGNGYLIDIGDARIYVSGDTECTDEMKALTDVDAAFVCMNLPYTMPPEEAATCVTAFRPAVAFPYHHRGSDLDVFAGPVEAAGIEVRRLDWYPAE